MKILINHLTRMKPGFVCVAGIELFSKKHIRPVLREQVSINLLKRNGGPFDIGNVVELGNVRASPMAPHYEDCLFDPREVKLIKTADAENFWRLLLNISKYTLHDIWTRSNLREEVSFLATR